MTTRQCGGCTLCCKLMAVPELDKPQNRWCKHCAIGTGCSIQGQPERPVECGNFNCLWLQGIGTDEMRPDKSKVVMSATKDGRNLVLYVDPSRPLAFREPAFAVVIDRFIKGGEREVFVVNGDKRTRIREE